MSIRVPLRMSSGLLVENQSGIIGVRNRILWTQIRECSRIDAGGRPLHGRTAIDQYRVETTSDCTLCFRIALPKDMLYDRQGLQQLLLELPPALKCAHLKGVDLRPTVTLTPTPPVSLKTRSHPRLPSCGCAASVGFLVQSTLRIEGWTVSFCRFSSLFSFKG